MEPFLWAAKRDGVLPREPRVAYLSSYLPRECGLATFTSDVVNAVTTAGALHEPMVVAMNEEDVQRTYPSIVKHVIQRDTLDSYRQAARAINLSDVEVVNIQHEHGLFGGDDGEHILSFIENVDRPVVTTFHTVIPSPRPHFRDVTRRVADLSSAVVVLAESARPIFKFDYDIDPEKVIFIPHGAPTAKKRPGTRTRMKRLLGYEDRLLIGTFGLISKNKGLEYVIRALPQVVAEHPRVLYLVLGETHPWVRQHEGEAYRDDLMALVRELGLEDHVQFKNQYLPFTELIRHLLAIDIYAVPYVEKNQIVSGTLAYAVALGKAIVASPFLYAEEILADGRGLLVGFRDAEGMSVALGTLLSRPDLRAQVEARAYGYGKDLRWPAVGRKYLDLFSSLAYGVAPEPEVVVPAMASWEIDTHEVGL